MMTPLDDDLLTAVRTAHSDPGYQPAANSPEASAMLADILRERHQDTRPEHGLLSRRRAVRAGVALAAVAAAVALVPLLAAPPAKPTAAPRPAHHAGTGVRLVAYNGTPHTYYAIQQIPVGWVIQGTSPEDLVIADHNDPDKDPNSFTGKLFVGMQLLGGPGGQKVSVNGHVAWYQATTSGDNTQMLQFQNIHGWWLIVQAPAALHWSMAQVIRFAAGVLVLPGARPGVG